MSRIRPYGCIGWTETPCKTNIEHMGLSIDPCVSNELVLYIDDFLLTLWGFLQTTGAITHIFSPLLTTLLVFVKPACTAAEK